MSTDLEPENGQQETPVRDAHRYINQRKDNLNYQGAQQRKLPIGSGEIESAHRHLIQKRSSPHHPARRLRQSVLELLLEKT